MEGAGFTEFSGERQRRLSCPLLNGCGEDPDPPEEGPTRKGRHGSSEDGALKNVSLAVLSKAGTEEGPVACPLSGAVSVVQAVEGVGGRVFTAGERAREGWQWETLLEE